MAVRHTALKIYTKIYSPISKLEPNFTNQTSSWNQFVEFLNLEHVQNIHPKLYSHHNKLVPKCQNESHPLRILFVVYSLHAQQTLSYRPHAG